MRISQRQMFSTYNTQMNTSLSSLLESNNQGGTGKRINRPSDDPAGMARVMMYRQSINNIERYKDNISEATGWLNLADHTLMQVEDIISRIKALDLQGSSGTVTGDNREQIAQQLRGYYGQLINLANTQYNGQHLFGGHKTDQPAFVEALGVNCKDPNLSKGSFVAEGGTEYSTLIQFTQNGDLSDANPGTSHPSFVYSEDGGKTWKEGTWQAGTWKANDPADPTAGGTWEGRKMVAGGVTLTPLPPTDGSAWGPVASVPVAFTPPDPNPNTKESDGGTWLTVRPTAIYKGDDHDTQITQRYGLPALPAGVTSADGRFTRDVAIRIDNAVPLNVPPAPVTPDDGKVTYSYSLDNGLTWNQAESRMQAGEDTLLPVPGGYFKLDAGQQFTTDQQFIIHPYRADLNLEISPNQTITVNMVGKDVFGGLYQEPFTKYPTPVNGGVNNVFETVGRLIGYAETNNQEGVSSCMDELTNCLKFVTTKNTEVGARENRLEVTFETMTMRELSESSGLSAVEDVDTITLMTKLAQQQLAYNTVLKTSSMVMQMSLMNFI